MMANSYENFRTVAQRAIEARQAIARVAYPKNAAHEIATAVCAILVEDEGKMDLLDCFDLTMRKLERPISTWDGSIG